MIKLNFNGIFFGFGLVNVKTETRFSLIQESSPVADSDNENYTSLKENRESYEPYWSLQKDDADLVRNIKYIRQQLALFTCNQSL